MAVSRGSKVASGLHNHTIQEAASFQFDSPANPSAPPLIFLSYTGTEKRDTKMVLGRSVVPAEERCASMGSVVGATKVHEKVTLLLFSLACRRRRDERQHRGG